MSNGQRRLAAIMFTDIVGYSAISQQDEERAVRLLDRHHQIINPILDAHQGRLVKSMGDGLMVEFSSAVEAARCAVEIQRAIHQDNKTHDHDNQINLRIGIHLGDVVERDGDLIGDGVNIAARIEPLAEAGGICITQQVLDQVENKINLPHISIGSPDLKNIQVSIEVFKLGLPWQPHHVPVTADEDKSWLPAPIQALIKKPSFRWGGLAAIATAASAIVWLGGWFPGNSSITATPASPAIAVLPFENLSDDPDNQYFSDGISEEILSRLSRVEGLRVAARSSSFVFRERSQPFKLIAEQLNVNTILEGSVRREGDQVRVNVALINAQDGFQMWANTYDYRIEDVFELQTEISSRIAEALELKLTASVENQGPPTENLDAYNAFLQGRFFWNKRTRDGFDKAQEYFEQAIELDPNYAQAYAGLADTFSLRINYGYATHNEAYLEAKQNALEALRLNDDLAEAHTSLAFISYEFERNVELAETHYRRAIELNPNYATARHWYSSMLEDEGVDSSLEQAKIAADLDPLSPIINVNLAVEYFRRKDYEQAESAVDKALEIDTDFIGARQIKANIKTLQGNLEEAEIQYERILASHPDDVRSYISMAALKQQQWDWGAADDWYQRALALDQAPAAQANVHFAYFNFLLTLGQYEDATYHLTKVDELNPSPDSSFADIFRPLLTYYYKGDYDEAVAAMEAMIEAGTHTIWASMVQGQVYLTMGELDQTWNAIERTQAFLDEGAEVIFRGSFQDNYDWLITSYYGLKGDKEAAEERIKILSERPTSNIRWEINAAAVYLMLGEDEKAWELLELVYSQNDPSLAALKSNPLINPLIKDDPRYTDLMQRINLEP